MGLLFLLLIVLVGVYLWRANETKQASHTSTPAKQEAAPYACSASATPAARSITTSTRPASKGYAERPNRSTQPHPEANPTNEHHGSDLLPCPPRAPDIIDRRPRLVREPRGR